jgi:hypothetical protein
MTVPEPVGDELFPPDDVEAGCWSPGPYGPGDELGTYHEVGSDQIAAALRQLDLSRPLRTFDMGYRLFPGYPAFGARSYRIRLGVQGLDPGPDFEGVVLNPKTRGDNRLSSLEERVEMTFNMGAKINGLHHAGVGSRFYGDRRLADIAAANGAGQLDTPSWGPPIVTRGMLLDVVAAKVAAGDDADLSADPTGRPLLRDRYRVTVEDLVAAIAHRQLPLFEPGDAIFVRTGWGQLVTTDPERFRSGSPGVFLRECRWLAASRPAIVGTDSWMWGTSDPAVTGHTAAACHQEMLGRFGIRVGEGIHLDELAGAGVDRFVFCHNPLRAEGAVSSNAPALAIANVPPAG